MTTEDFALKQQAITAFENSAKLHNHDEMVFATVNVSVFVWPHY